MSAVINKYDDSWGFGPGQHNEKRCSNCGGELHYPFLGWDGACGGTGIFICGACCVRWRDGLAADMIQCAAIVEIQQLGRMGGVTLIRKNTSQLEAEGKKEQEEIKRIEQEEIRRDRLRTVKP